MNPRIGEIALLVPDYDDAISYFTEILGFRLLEDAPREGGKRWVRVGPAGSTGTALLLARAATPEQRASIGRQFAGRVGLFLHTDDFVGDHARMKQAGVEFTEAPREEVYGTVCVFRDRWGNRWDLIQLREVAT